MRALRRSVLRKLKPRGRQRMTLARPSSLLKKVFEVSRWATLIQDPSARRTKDSQPSGFGFEYCASHVRLRVFQQTARAVLPLRILKRAAVCDVKEKSRHGSSVTSSALC